MQALCKLLKRELSHRDVLSKETDSFTVHALHLAQPSFLQEIFPGYHMAYEVRRVRKEKSSKGGISYRE